MQKRAEKMLCTTFAPKELPVKYAYRYHMITSPLHAPDLPCFLSIAFFLAYTSQIKLDSFSFTFRPEHLDINLILQLSKLRVSYMYIEACAFRVCCFE